MYFTREKDHFPVVFIIGHVDFIQMSSVQEIVKLSPSVSLLFYAKIHINVRHTLHAILLMSGLAEFRDMTVLLSLIGKIKHQQIESNKNLAFPDIAFCGTNTHLLFASVFATIGH